MHFVLIRENTCHRFRWRAHHWKAVNSCESIAFIYRSTSLKWIQIKWAQKFPPFFSFVPEGDHVTLFVRHENGKVLTISDTNASISGLSFIDLDCWCWWCRMVSLSVQLFVDFLVLKPKFFLWSTEAMLFPMLKSTFPNSRCLQPFPL